MSSIECLHQKSGKTYWFGKRIHIQIFGIWFHLTQYQDKETYDLYYRFTADFNKKFLIKE